MKKCKKCCIRIVDFKRCQKPFFQSLKIRVFHYISLRKTWQTWNLCYDHFQTILKNNAENWVVLNKKQVEVAKALQALTIDTFFEQKEKKNQIE